MNESIFDRMRRAQEEMEYLLSEFFHFRQPLALGTEVGFRPSVDLYETPSCLVVLAELPGVNLESVEISLGERSLTIRGMRESPLSSGERRSYHKMEITFGAFRRRIPLPCSVDPEGMEVSSTNGLLRIELPKVPAREREARVIPIE